MIKYICDECSSTIEVYYVKLNINGETLHFCEEDCLADYLKSYVERHSCYDNIDGDNYEE